MNSPILPENLITHSVIYTDLNATVAELKDKIIKAGPKPDTTIEEQLDLLTQLSKFGFGQCLITNRGITGLWTRHMVLYPRWRKEQPELDAALTPLNRWLLNQSPVVLATQQRFTYFQKLLQENLHDNMTIASIPCGLMDDLLTLDYKQTSNIQLVGIDLDKEALSTAEDNAKKHHLEKQASFRLCNAWQIEYFQEFDMITSNGLNFYEADNEKVVALYKKFHAALKPNGLLITSFLTPPPSLHPDSSWDMEKINKEDLRIQKVLFTYILTVRFQAYRTEQQTKQQLIDAGFKDIKFIYDKAKLFPTVWCRA